METQKKSYVLYYIIIGLLLLIIISGLFALSRNNSRTILIYMVGADLESEMGLASKDLNGLDYSKIPNNTNVILIAGGAHIWYNNYVNPNETSIYELQKTGFVKVQTKTISNMGNKELLTNFINYGYENYKANKYSLIFWNHGGAIDGSEYDDLSGDHLSLLEMKEALSKTPFNSSNKLEFIGFRTCLNGTIEVANTFKDYANYLFASEEVTRGSTIGGSALDFLNNMTGSESTITLGKKFIEGYLQTIRDLCQQTAGIDYCVNTTYSILDLQKTDSALDSLNEFYGSIDLNKNFNEISKIRANEEQFAETEGDSYDMIDLMDLSKKLKDYSSYEYSKLEKALNKLVVYSFSNNEYANGVSVYFPYNETYFLKNYKEHAGDSKYSQFIEKFHNIQINGETAYNFASFSKSTGSVQIKNKDEADFELDLTDEEAKNIAKASYMVFVDNKDGNFKLLYSGVADSIENNKIKTNIKGKMLKVCDIDNEKDCYFLSLAETSKTSEYIDYKTIAVLQKYLGKFDSDVVQIKLRNENGNVRIISAELTDKVKSNKSSTPVFSNNLVDFNKYESIIFGSTSYKITNENGEYTSDWVSNGLFVGVEHVPNEFKIVEETFDNPNNEYYSVFHIYDVNGRDYYSKIVKMN